jgi:flagellar biogenesis protein FliO
MATPASTADAVDPTAPLVFGVEVDPVLVGIIAVLLLIVFGIFLFVRKTLLSLSKGMRDGKRR